MRSKYRASLFNFFFNSFNTVVIIVNGIIMVPIYFKYISLSTYGALLASGNVVSMLGLLEAGYASVITQKMSSAIARSDEELFRKFAGANISSAFIIAAAIFLIGMSVSPYVADWVNAPLDQNGNITQAYILALLSASISILVSLFGAFPQVWQDTKAVGIISVVSNVTAIIALVIFLLMGCGVVSIPLSYLVRSVMNLFIQGTWILKKWHNLKLKKPLFESNILIEILKNCIMPFMSKTSSSLMYHSQSFLISAFIGPSFSAIYDLTSKVTQCICGFLGNVNGSFFALFAITINKGNRDETQTIFDQVSTTYNILLTLALLFSLYFTMPIMHYWVGLEKYGGIVLLILIVLSSYTNQSKTFLNNVLYCGGLINKSAKYDIYCMACYLVILGLSINYLKIYAIPVALFLSTMVFLLFYLKVLKQHIGIDANFLIRFIKRNLPFVVLFAVIGIIITVFFDDSPIIAGLLCICACLGFITSTLQREKQYKSILKALLWKRKTY